MVRSVGVGRGCVHVKRLNSKKNNKIHDTPHNEVHDIQRRFEKNLKLPTHYPVVK
jgi:hypothetical protein